MVQWSLYVLAKFGEVGSTHSCKALSVLPNPLGPKIARKNVLNRQYLSRGLFDYAQILYRV